MPELNQVQVGNLLQFNAADPGIGAGGRPADAILADVIARLTGDQPVVGVPGHHGHIPATTAAEFQNDLVQYATPVQLSGLLAIDDADFAPARKEQLVTALSNPERAPQVEALLAHNPAMAGVIVQHAQVGGFGGEPRQIDEMFASADINDANKGVLVGALSVNIPQAQVFLTANYPEDIDAAADAIVHYGSVANINTLLAGLDGANKPALITALAGDPAKANEILNPTPAVATARAARAARVAGDANAALIAEHGTPQAVSDLLRDANINVGSKAALTAALAHPARAADAAALLDVANFNDPRNLEAAAAAVAVNASAIAEHGSLASVNTLLNGIDDAQKPAFVAGLAGNADKINGLLNPAAPAAGGVGAAADGNATLMITHGSAESIAGLLNNGNAASKEALLGQLLDNANNAKLQGVLALPNGSAAIVGAGTTAQLHGLFNRVNVVGGGAPVVALNGAQKQGFVSVLAANPAKADALVGHDAANAGLIIQHGTAGNIAALLNNGNDASKEALLNVFHDPAHANSVVNATKLNEILGDADHDVATANAVAIINKSTPVQIQALEARNIAGNNLTPESKHTLKVAKASIDMGLSDADRNLFANVMHDIPADQVENVMIGIKAIKGKLDQQYGDKGPEAFTAALQDMANKVDPDERIATLGTVNKLLDVQKGNYDKKLSRDIDKQVGAQNDQLDKENKDKISGLEQSSSKDRGEAMKYGAGTALLVFVGIALISAAPILGAFVLLAGAYTGSTALSKGQQAASTSLEIHNIKTDITNEKADNFQNAAQEKAESGITDPRLLGTRGIGGTLVDSIVGPNTTIGRMSDRHTGVSSAMNFTARAPGLNNVISAIPNKLGSPGIMSH